MAYFKRQKRYSISQLRKKVAYEKQIATREAEEKRLKIELSNLRFKRSKLGKFSAFAEGLSGGASKGRKKKKKINLNKIGGYGKNLLDYRL